jgi:hypothetical protein
MNKPVEIRPVRTETPAVGAGLLGGAIVGGILAVPLLRRWPLLLRRARLRAGGCGGVLYAAVQVL